MNLSICDKSRVIRLKIIKMEPDQSELDSLTGYKNTHSSVFSLLCTHTCLDAFIGLTIFLHPAQAQVQFKFAEGFTKGSGPASATLRHRMILVQTPWQMWNPQVHLKLCVGKVEEASNQKNLR